MLPTIHPQGIMLRQGEVCHHASAAAVYVEVYGREYVSHTSNWHGFRSHRGHYVQTHQTQMAAQGTFCVTNASVRFIGTSTLTYPLSEISGYNYDDNALELLYEARRQREVFVLTDGELAAATIVGAKRVAETGAPPAGPYR
jgi:hypothetical protein